MELHKMNQENLRLLCLPLDSRIQSDMDQMDE